MSPDLILDKGTAKLRPVIIKTCVVERPNLTSFGSRSSGQKGAEQPTVFITLPRVDALRKTIWAK